MRNITLFELGFALCTLTGSPHTIVIRWEYLAAPFCSATSDTDLGTNIDITENSFLYAAHPNKLLQHILIYVCYT